MKEIAVVYLYRFAEGDEPAKRFVDSYRAHSAGTSHDLCVIFKGFPGASEVAEAKALFGDLSVHTIVLPDTGFDIGSYFAAARTLRHEIVCFVNTFSRIRVDGWLVFLVDALTRPDVGVVGATGSWQSPSATNFPFGFQWRSPLATLGYLRGRCAYPGFPNSHIRSNVFMLRRDLFLSLGLPSIRTKEAAYKVESGRRSLARQVMRRGLRAVVVDNRGAIYESGDWAVAQTFWSGDQGGLIVSDNQTDDYEFGSEHHRAFLNSCAWSDPREIHRPRSFLANGVDFAAALTRASGLEPQGSGVWKLTGSTGSLAEWPPRFVRGQALIDGEVTVWSASPVWLSFLMLDGDRVRAVSFGPVVGTRPLRGIAKFARRGSFVLLFASGQAGATFRLTRLTLRRIGALERLRVLEKALPGATRRIAGALLGYPTVDVASRRRGLGRYLEGLRRTYREQKERFAAPALRNYPAWIAEAEGYVASDRPEASDVSVIAYLTKAGASASWWRAFADAIGEAQAVVLVPKDSARSGETIRLKNVEIREYSDCGSTARLIASAVVALTDGYVVLLDERHALHRNYLKWIALMVCQAGHFDWIYCDEDTATGQGERTCPIFKPDWSPILESWRGYTGSVIAYRREFLEALDGDELLAIASSQRSDERRVALATARRVGHLRQIGVHRLHSDGLVDTSARPPVHSPGSSNCRISIVIPTAMKTAELRRGRATNLLRNVVESIRQNTAWPDYEIIAVTPPEISDEMQRFAGEQGVTLVKTPRLAKPNLSAKMNLGAKAVNGELVVFLNDDIEIIEPKWLGYLAEHGLRPEVGVVGALLLFEDGSVQHRGVVADNFRVSHLHTGLRPEEGDDLGWLSVPHERTAVTGACLAIRRQLFEEIGGFDEQIAFVFNDADLCLRVRQRGLSVVIDPRARLIHFERTSHVLTLSDRRDEGRFRERWLDALQFDSYWPPVLHERWAWAVPDARRLEPRSRL